MILLIPKWNGEIIKIIYLQLWKTSNWINQQMQQKEFNEQGKSNHVRKHAKC